MRKNNKFGMLSVKAGVDKNPNPTQADRIAGATMAKGGRATLKKAVALIIQLKMVEELRKDFTTT